MTDRTFKIHIGDEIRRFAAPVEGSPYAYSIFASKVAELFAGEQLTFKWKDTDGDLITIANADEFNEALKEQPTGPVRLWAVPTVSRTSSGVESKPVEAEPTPEPTPTPTPPPTPPPIEPVVHQHVTCDVSEQSPLRGTRYHKIGANYDVNEASFAELSEPEKQFYEIILYPGAVPVPYEPVIHYGVICDATNVGPIIGLRFHKIGEDYDLCQKEFAKLDEEEKQKYELISHPRKLAFAYKKPESSDGSDGTCGQENEFFKLFQNAVKVFPGGVDVDLTELANKFNRNPNPNQNQRQGCGRNGRGPRHCGPKGCGGGRGGGGGGRKSRSEPKEVSAGELLPSGTFGTGSYGAGVEQLQRFLVAQGLMSERAIAFRVGVYGPRTRRTIADFQRTNEIRADVLGEYNDATRDALVALAAVGSVPPPEKISAPATEEVASKNIPEKATAADKEAVPVPSAPETLTVPPKYTEDSGTDDVAAGFEKISPPVQMEEDKTDSVDDSNRHADQLKLLNQMGFNDNVKNVKILDKVHGSLHATLAELLK
jgi:hypothetical protein